MGEGVHLNVSNLDTFLINVPILPVVDLPGGKDLAVPALQSKGGVRVDTALSVTALHVPGTAVPALGETVDGVLERTADVSKLDTLFSEMFKQFFVERENSLFV